MDYLIEYLKKNKVLKQLSLSGLGFNDSTFERIIDAAIQAVNLDELQVNDLLLSEKTKDRAREIFEWKHDATPRSEREKQQRLMHIDNKFRPANSSCTQSITADFSANTKENMKNFKQYLMARLTAKNLKD